MAKCAGSYLRGRKLKVSMRMDIEKGEDELGRNLSKSEASAKSVLLIFPAVLAGGFLALGGHRR